MTLHLKASEIVTSDLESWCEYEEYGFNTNAGVVTVITIKH